MTIFRIFTEGWISGSFEPDSEENWRNCLFPFWNGQKSDQVMCKKSMTFHAILHFKEWRVA